MEKVCKQCGTVAEPAAFTKGSFRMEVILWLLFIIPGLLYSFWRLASRHDVCSACGSTDLIPLETPMGQKMAASAGYVPQRRPPSETAHGVGRTVGRLVAKIKHR